MNRYGRGGTYWSGAYHTKYPTAAPLPIQTYQIWNEPNLKKYFVPYPAPKTYARLLHISYAAIKSEDSQAQIALAGMPSNGDVQASSFLNSLYSAGAKPDFDIASLHPYAKTITRQEEDIERFHNVMINRNDRTTPLWLTELAWGSAPPDQFGINKGLEGQRQYLRGTFNLVLDNRKAWNVQRLFWYRWRDPADPQATCSFCGSAGFLKPNKDRKPSWDAFRSFASETVPPTASITSGPAAGSTTTDSTPTFRFASSEHGSTFECKIDASAYQDLRLTSHAGATRGRRPHVLRPGDRCSRQREPGPLALLHGRRGLASASSDRRQRARSSPPLPLGVWMCRVQCGDLR